MSVAINIRVSKQEKEMLTKVADIMGTSLSSMLRAVAIAQAHRVLGPPKPVDGD